jgi:hypothetical protein
MASIIVRGTHTLDNSCLFNAIELNDSQLLPKCSVESSASGQKQGNILGQEGNKGKIYLTI